MPHPRLETYQYGLNYGTSDKKVKFDLTANADASFGFDTPFEGTDDKKQWKLGFVPYAKIGGQQVLAWNFYDYFSGNIKLDLWGANLKIADT